jgi:3-oxoacyl-(acyl-carrier-protein) synthase
VRTLGRTNPAGYTAGGRTTAGSLIFATFNRRALEELYTGSDYQTAAVNGTLSDARIRQPTDTISPFDIILYFTSEHGNDSVMYIYRVQIVDEGQTFSIQDVYTEHTMQYMASGISMLEKIDDVWKRAYIGEGAIFNNLTAIHRAEAAGLII